MPRSDDIHDCLFCAKSVVVGDLNARHRSFGSPLRNQNSNGFTLYDITDAYENVEMLGNGQPTQVRGGRLDYAILFNMNELEASADILYELLSYYFALKVKLGVDKVCIPSARSRYKLKNDQHRELISKVSEWYKDYKHAVHDENQFYEDLLKIIDFILVQAGGVSQSTYFADKQVKGWNTLLGKAHSLWSKDPNDTSSQSAMLQIAECTNE
ncbi:hypothetical protein SK128_015661, partial [Halocaridina rubra]